MCVSLCLLEWRLQGGYPPGNISHIPSQGIFEDDFPFPKVKYVSSLERYLLLICRKHKEQIPRIQAAKHLSSAGF